MSSMNSMSYDKLTCNNILTILFFKAIKGEKSHKYENSFFVSYKKTGTRKYHILKYDFVFL